MFATYDDDIGEHYWNMPLVHAGTLLDDIVAHSPTWSIDSDGHAVISRAATAAMWGSDDDEPVYHSPDFQVVDVLHRVGL